MSSECSSLSNLAKSLNHPQYAVFECPQNQSHSNYTLWNALGVQLNVNYSVIAIDWSNKGLNGTIANTLGSLNHLTVLNLNNNQIIGVLPAQMPLSLVTLNIGNNILRGSLPNMQNMVTLNIQYNQFSGSLPNFPNLVRLYANYNSLSGNITTLPLNLAQLGISFNKFSGAFPAISSKYNYLQNIYINYNDFTGTFSLASSNTQAISIDNNRFTSLQLTGYNLALSRLYGFKNQLTNANLLSAYNLITLDLSSNLLTTAPELLTNTPVSIQLSNNQITYVWMPPSATFFDAGNNQITSMSPYIPSGLQKLVLSNNAITQNLTNVVFPSSLTELFLTNNSFSGTLNVTSAVKSIDVSYNQLNSVIIGDTSNLFIGNCNLKFNPLDPSKLGSLTKRCLYSPLKAPATTSTTAATLRTSQMSSSSHSDQTSSLIATFQTTANPATSSKYPFSTHSTFASTFVDGHQVLSMLDQSSSSETTENWSSDNVASDSAKLIPTRVLFRHSSTFQSINDTQSPLWTTEINGAFTDTPLPLQTSQNGNDSTFNNQNAFMGMLGGNLIYILVGSVIALMIILVILGKVIKRPKINSKFARNSSNGTLQTTATSQK
eukprot:NODE_509_length_6670_cov_0.463856.p2 type:complete len:604 gc:universal NODE_509_length_6670_cov_0.463856:4077-5888(+)